MLPYRWGYTSRILGLAVALSLSYYAIFTSRHTSAWNGFSVVDEIKVEGKSEIWNATLGFQKLFVINMPSRTDRRDATSLSAAVSGIEVDFIDGIDGDSILEAAFPPEGSRESIKLSKGIKGSWRSHMNTLHEIVHYNLSSALIFEDDVDWDIQLRQQLQKFASASRFLTKQPAPDLSDYQILTTMNPEDPELSIHNDSSLYPISPALHSIPLSSVSLEFPDTSSAYGNPANWDILWLGHCGAGFPRTPPTLDIPQNTKNILLTNPDDETVPLPKYLRAHPFGPLDALAASHSPHTRVYHRASGGALCTIAYAVSQRGARRLLHEFGVKRWSRIWDVEMGDWCAGSDFLPPKDQASERREYADDEKRRKGERVCITVQPPIFAHHHPAGGESNIGGVGGGYARAVETKYVRKSVRLNLEALLRGEGEDGMVDQWPD